MSDPQPPYGHPGSPPPAHPYAAPYVVPQHPQFAAAATYSAPPSRALGVVALVLALVTLVAAPLVAGIAAFRIGLGTGRDVALLPATAEWNWRVLSPVRDWVLLGEISFWVGTVLGTWALIQGIVAIAKRRGRGQGIAAVVIAVVALGAFVVVAWTALFLGLTSGASIGA
ncbi:MAG TPA: hypothetical protein VNT50_12910 [Microbacterium sp.]|uniref:hypothetical protein n=1 Tax=Microbacterium sp. TaxID=51671 RepID=UPI002CF019CD|nr:hypothetical protein [Microbacterium sp.]HWI32377.1 hypothetical protein [Microbacterium sp.]